MALPIAIFVAALILRAIGIEMRIRNSSGEPRFPRCSHRAGELHPRPVDGLHGGERSRRPGDRRQGRHAGRRPFPVNPFSILGALLSGAVFALHGSLFLGLRTTGDFRSQIEGLGQDSPHHTGGSDRCRILLVPDGPQDALCDLERHAFFLGLARARSGGLRFRVGECPFRAQGARLRRLVRGHGCDRRLFGGAPLSHDRPFDPRSVLRADGGESRGRRRKSPDFPRSTRRSRCPLVLIYVFVSYRSIGRRRRDRGANS